MGVIKNTGLTIVAVLLVIGVVVGGVVYFKGSTPATSNATSNVATNAASTTTTSTSSKTVDAICEPTKHKDACVTSMQSVKPDGSIKDYIEAAVRATIVEVKKAINATDNVVVNKDDDPHNDQAGLAGCKDFLLQTIDQLDAAISQVEKFDIHTIEERTHDFIAWVTGANIYIQTCISEMEKPEYKAAVENGTLSASQLVENALYIFSKVKEVVGALDITDSFATIFSGDNTSKSARKLLTDVSEDGFPSWISNGDRKLLQLPAVAPTVTPAAPAAAVPAAPAATTAAVPAVPAATTAAVSAAPAAPAAVPAPAPAPALAPVTVAGIGTIVPNVIVAQDGSGQFKTITEAVNTVPDKNTQRFIIYVKAGKYNEAVLIKRKDNVFLLGDGIGKTIITGNQCNLLGFKTSLSATVGVDSDFFMARGITFENTAGPEGHQAVALRINGEKAVIFECEMTSYQDTLYYHKGLQFYKNCIISGTVDFIFGNGRAIIQDTKIIVRKPGPNQANMITADGGLDPNGQHGLVLQNCKISAEPGLMAVKDTVKTYLGRPWKAYAVTTYLQNDIDDFITPEGYSVFALTGPESLNQVNSIYSEYMNTGPGANNTARDLVAFPKFKVLQSGEADLFTVAKYINGPTWLPATGVPFKVGL